MSPGVRASSTDLRGLDCQQAAMERSARCSTRPDRRLYVRPHRPHGARPASSLSAMSPHGQAAGHRPPGSTDEAPNARSIARKPTARRPPITAPRECEAVALDWGQADQWQEPDGPAHVQGSPSTSSTTGSSANRCSPVRQLPRLHDRRGGRGTRRVPRKRRPTGSSGTTDPARGTFNRYP